MTTSIFLDESGCLGWTLSTPTGKNTSSQYLVLAAVEIQPGKNDLVHKVIRGLYKMRNRSHRSELKSTHLAPAHREHFAKEVIKLTSRYPGDVLCHAAVAEKKNVPQSLRDRSEALYIHMAEQMLHGVIARCPRVDFYPDARTVKPKDKNALHNYLETRLAISGFAPELNTMPSESGDNFEIQFADILASIVWSHYEHQNQLYTRGISQVITTTKVY